MLEPLLTVKDIALLWKSTPGGIRNQILRGAFPVPPIPASSPCARILWRPKDVRAYLEADTVPAKAAKRGGVR